MEAAGYPLRKSYLDNIGICRFCDSFAEKSQMVRVDPPGEDGYYVCRDCHDRYFVYLFPRHGRKRV